MKMSLKNTCYLPKVEHCLKGEKLCDEAKVSLKIEAVFFILFEPGYRYVPFSIDYDKSLSGGIKANLNSF